MSVLRLTQANKLLLIGLENSRDRSFLKTTQNQTDRELYLL